MIRVFAFHDPWDGRYAHAVRRGTWYPSPGPGLCPECGSARQKIVPPLVIEWLPGSDTVGDFTWPGFDTEIVVSEGVRRELGARFRGVEFQPMEMWQSPRLKRPQRANRRTRPRVWLPYEGPPLWSMWVTAYAHLDMDRSGWTVERVCSTCGRVRRKGPPEGEWPLYVDPATWEGEEIFGLHESGLVFCIEEVKRFIEGAGFTNVSFLEEGVIPV